MKNARLLSTVAATVLLSAGVAFAQAPAKDKDSGASPAPAAQQNAPAEKTAPNMKAGQPNAETHKAPETTGQAPAASDAGKTGATEKSMDKGAADKSMNKNGADKGAADSGAAKNPSGTTGQSTTQTPNRAESPANTPKSSQTTSDPAKSSTSSQSTTEQRSTTGQGSAAGSAKLSTEQRTQITTVFKQQRVERVEPSKLNISISVGTRVPNTVRYHPIPQEVVVIYPEWRGFDYIMVGNQIVVLDPRSHEIVAILDA
jgi:hypothetical protein